jgi:hypothetical protein
MRSDSEADRGRDMTELIFGFENFANATERKKFSYSREIPKLATITGKFKGTNLKINFTFKTS